MSTRLTAIVPARSGSKRLPNKNIKVLNGRPLLFHTLDAVTAQEHVCKTLFTSDSEEYLSLVQNEYGNDVTCVFRPDQFAADNTKVTDEVERLITNHDVSSEWFLLSLPTSPLFNHYHMEKYLSHWAEHPAPTFTCNEYDFSPLFAFSIDENNRWNGLMEDKSPMNTGNTRSQDLKTYYRPNGAGYICRSQDFLKNKIFYRDAMPYVIPPHLGLDIDNLNDFRRAEFIMENFDA